MGQLTYGFARLAAAKWNEILWIEIPKSFFEIILWGSHEIALSNSSLGISNQPRLTEQKLSFTRPQASRGFGRLDCDDGYLHYQVAPVTPLISTTRTTGGMRVILSGVHAIIFSDKYIISWL